jgi:hypothetical protein
MRDVSQSVKSASATNASANQEDAAATPVAPAQKTEQNASENVATLVAV